MNIEGIPDTITEERVREIFTSLGINPKHVAAGDDDGLLRIGWDCLEVTLYALRPDHNGNPTPYVDTATMKPATHRISIPVTHPKRGADA